MIENENQVAEKHLNDEFRVDLCVRPKEYFFEVVGDAMVKRKVVTFPLVRNYLAELLEHFMDSRNLHEEVDEGGKRRNETLAEALFRAQSSGAPLRSERLKRLGDTSLYVSGFFGDSLQRKVVDVDYYAEIGGIAYSSLAKSVSEDTFSKMYYEIATRFLDFVDVLGYISHQTLMQSQDNLLRLYDRFLQTGSSLARDQLLAKGLITIELDSKKLKQ